MLRIKAVQVERIGILLTLAALLLLAFAGCDTLLSLLQPSTVRVELRNNGDYVVDVTLYYGESQSAPRDVLTTLGTQVEYSISPGETAAFSRDCDDLRAIVIDEASLRVIGQAGPSTDGDVLRDDDDFDCGDTIVFTFDHGPLLVDFAVQTSVEQGAFAQDDNANANDNGN